MKDDLLVGVESRMKEIKRNLGWEVKCMQFQEMLEEERREGFSAGHAASLAEGHASGLAEGHAAGLEEKHQQMLALIASMTGDGKLADIPRLGEEEFFQAMLARYGLV